MNTNDSFFWPVCIEDNTGRIEGDKVASHIAKNIVVTEPMTLSDAASARDPQRYIVHSASKEYGLVPNAEFFPALEQVFKDEGFTYKVRYKASSCKARFIADFDLVEQSSEIVCGGKIDSLVTMFRVCNSYNGRLVFSIVAGVKRLVCANGLVGFTTDNIIEIKHTSGNCKELAEKTFSSMKRLLERQSQIIAICQRLADEVPVSWELYLDDLIEQCKISKKLKVPATLRLQEEVRLGYPVSKWLIVNALQYSIWSASKASFEHKIALEQKLFKLATR